MPHTYKMYFVRTRYQNLSDGHLAFAMCKKIRDTPFPFPYAQLMSFLLVMFCLSFPFVATWAVPAQDNWPWKARIISFLVCMSLFALNEVARELEVPFHVAHNDINIEELHDEFLSMLETLHTNFSKLQESRFHNDLSELVITPEHILDRACNCAKCDAEIERQQDKSAEKASMVWNTTDTATRNEEKKLKKLLNKPDFDFGGLDFHKLQALQLSKLQRAARKDTAAAPHALDSESLDSKLECLQLAARVRDHELECLQLAARVRDRIPPNWTAERKLQFIGDIDLWLLLEAKHGMRENWRSQAVKKYRGDSRLETTKASMRGRSGRRSVRKLRPVKGDADGAWEIANVTGFGESLDSMLKAARQNERSVIGSNLKVKEHERDEKCELMYLWQQILDVKRGGSDGTDPIELPLEEQDWFDHASVFMSSRLTHKTRQEEEKHDKQRCKTNIELYRRPAEDSQATVVDRLYNESVIRILERIPLIERRPRTAHEDAKMGSLALSVLESKERDYEKYQQLRKNEPSIGNQDDRENWLEELKRLEAPKLTEKEQADLNKLRREKYGRLFASLSLKELKALAKANHQSSKDMMTDEEKRVHEREWEKRGESVQEAYLLRC